ncbi:GNAT family N-acetyltransferase [Salinarimonas soli]|uniref:GNAT family N-acetyltransferase n=1 Tax=Salinarimonas soli TaxID=1638099 RepID=A0A5B2VU38_9HYPH|nr:GNAT family N-acetyltransferase [Salinarimonas soli]KAA2242118.1 GNAT family N-acetyltransferase [Salinarimonas soli]
MAPAIREATREDIAFIIGLERAPANARLIGRFEAERHAALLDEPDSRHLLGVDGAGEPFGFAILWGLCDPNGNVLLKRTAVAGPGEGLGRPFLERVVDWVFARPESHRLWLTVAPYNPRAQRVYATLGFVEEGRQREALIVPEGGRVDVIQMSILRPEWAARQRTP